MRVHFPRSVGSVRRAPRWLLPTVLVGAVLVAACGSNPSAVVSGKTDSSGSSTTTDGGAASGPSSSDGNVATTNELTDVYPGMPPVVDRNNLYSEVRPGNDNPNTKGALFRVYVPGEVSGDVTVIDPTTLKVVDEYKTGNITQHVVPSYDMTTLYALNNSSNTITPIDPKTGKKMPDIHVTDPYNLYFMPDGSEAIVVEESNQKLTFTDPKTFAVHSSLSTQCNGINHMDFSIDGKYALVTCEFDGTILKVDLLQKKVVGTLKIDISKSGKQNPIKPIAQPQDVRVSPDGKVFYVADLITDGVYTIDGDSFTQTGFIPTGIGTHGLYPSRDGTKLYVINRGTEMIPPVGTFKGKGKGSVAVLDFATQKVVAVWPVDGGSPDMGNLTEDGTQLWLGGRYDNEVYVIDTVKGQLIARIPAGQNPHGLTVWPQPGRYSLGHTGNMR
jgi:YVTN family beta-propeller protein